MAAQKWKINLLAEFPLHIFECLLTQNPTNQGSQLSRFFHNIWMTIRRGSRELFLPENDFKTCYTANFPEKLPDFGHLETNQRYEIHTSFLFSHALLHMNSI